MQTSSQTAFKPNNSKGLQCRAAASDSKALEFDYIANEIFSPIYPVIAQQILAYTQSKSGTCLDLGSGGGHLGLAIASQAEHHIKLLDINPKALAISADRAALQGMTERTDYLHSSVEAIALADNSVDLCVSRGSMWFWPNPQAAFDEILRVLKPGSYAYIGAGFGNLELRTQVDEKMRQFDPTWPAQPKSFQKGHTAPFYRALLASNPFITQLRIIDDHSGFWITFQHAEVNA